MTAAIKPAKSSAKRDERSMDYDEAKRLARSEIMEERRRLAASRRVRPEILYFLASDPVAAVRRAIAANPDTPRQADLVLARDVDQGVRESLAAKIARILPELTPSEHDSVYRMTVEVLETLARDQATRVRGIVAETLKDVARAPTDLIGRLARDDELEVAAPVLEFSPLLTEADLIEIIAASPASGALGAIARRRGLGDGVADAIVDTGDTEAVSSLLGNASAQIREETLNRIIDQAPECEAWHAPLVKRPALKGGMVLRIARFVADSLLRTLRDRSDLDEATVKAVASEVDRRLETPAAKAAKKAGSKTKPADEDDNELAPASGAPPPAAPAKKAKDIVAQMEEQGTLNEDAVMRAVISGDRAFAIEAMARRSGITVTLIERLMSMRSAKGLVSLVWKCGFTMRLAAQLQLRMAGIPPQSVLRAKGGVDFPLPEADMEWQINFIKGLGQG